VSLIGGGIQSCHGAVLGATSIGHDRSVLTYLKDELPGMSRASAAAWSGRGTRGRAFRSNVAAFAASRQA